MRFIYTTAAPERRLPVPLRDGDTLGRAVSMTQDMSPFLVPSPGRLVWPRRAGCLAAFQACVPSFSSRIGHFQSLGNLLGEEASAVMKAKMQGEC